MSMTAGKEFTAGKFLLPAAAFVLMLWGGLTILSSQSVNDGTALAVKHFAFMTAGLLLMLVVSRIKFPWFSSKNFYLLSAFSLASLWLLPVAGTKINGMRGWYHLGSFLVQPSEIGKVFFLLLLAKLAAMEKWSKFKRFSALAIMTLLWVCPVLLQPDFGTAAVYLLTAAAVFFLAGCPVKYLLSAGIAGAAAAGAFIMTHPYSLRRITSFLNPEADPSGGGWHIRQLQLAIARGGWTGTKLGQAYWSNAYLPLPYNDSAYATLSETLGFLGAVPVVVLMGIICAVLFRQSQSASLSQHARLYLAGSGAMLAIQTLLHISVNTGLIPPTGLTLPFISYGGSSIFASCLMLGAAMSAGTESR